MSAQRMLTVAAAADLGPALREIASQYEKQSGARISVVIGSSGNLTTQIEHGAPYDLFFSADVGYPERLAGEGLTAGKPAVYAVGKLVLWVPNNSKINLQKMSERALADASVHKIAIANPQHAPYGKAAVAFLEGAKLYEQVKPKLVMGENVAQAAEFAISGNADAAIIPLSLALEPGMKTRGRYREVDSALYPAIRQGAVVLKKSNKPAAAARFLGYVLSAEGERVLARYGFAMPEGRR
jgi:molybdate transport system substrate-binding protein